MLFDVSAMAREAGFRWPVALTCAAWERRVAVPPGVAYQDEVGRLWDVLTMLCFAIRPSGDTHEVRFGIHVRNNNLDRTPPQIRLKAVSGPGDDGAPCITVILLNED
jgi:hypothetical protein